MILEFGLRALLLAMLIAALFLEPADAAKPRVEILRVPGVVMPEYRIEFEVHVPPDESNRTLRVEARDADGETVRSSDEPLERTTQVEFPILWQPLWPGDYLLEARVVDDRGKVWTAEPKFLLVSD